MSDHQIDHTVLNDAMASVRKRKQMEREQVERQHESPESGFGRRRDNLRAALSVVRNDDYVTLPELSRRSPSGEPVRLRVRRLTVQELAASELIPRRADAMVSKLIEMGMGATRSARSEYNIPDTFDEDEIDRVVEELYGGWTRDALAAFFELQCVVCCAAVIDDNYRLYMDYDDVKADPERGVYVWELPDEDLTTIFTWAMKQEGQAEETVMPFRDGEKSGVFIQPEP